jgi:hypothetical protein
MSDETRIDPKHSSTRSVLRLAGPVVAGVGLILIIVGVASFFTSFAAAGQGQHAGPPRLFWCFFLGIPLLFVGAVMCMFGFFGAMARYVAAEGAPVQKDTFNYLAQGTKEGVQTVATALGAGLAASMAGGKGTTPCPRCAQETEADARFCKHCGAPLLPGHAR